MVVRTRPDAARIRRAVAYFKRNGIDPRVEPPPETFPSDVLRAPRYTQLTATGITTEACSIEVSAYFFYAHVEVIDMANYHTFEGHSGGIGLGDIFGIGVIYYADLPALLATTDFGVFFGAEAGGAMHVTWGTHGNATVGGIGEGIGAFGGRGSWK